LRVLDVWYYGTRHMTNDTRPINRVADLNGLKMRVPEVKLSLEFMKALGGRPTPMAFPELYLGLQTGVVDGQENPLPTINSAKFFEVQKHLALTRHLVQMVAPIVAEDAWQAASEADRAIVIEVLQAEGAEYSAAIAKLEGDLVTTLEGKGMQVTPPGPDGIRQCGSADLCWLSPMHGAQTPTRRFPKSNDVWSFSMHGASFSGWAAPLWPGEVSGT
jgi:TRAP-type C4-dicarboxylate transport system substrate-binding protein